MSQKKQNSPEHDVVISSRVRLARNYKDIPFPPRMDEECAQETISRANAAIFDTPQQYQLKRMAALSKDDRNELVEHRLISYDLLKYEDYAAVLISTDRTSSIMVNEEDHLRIQGLLPGMQLESAASLAFEADEKLSESGDYAFDPQWGYLTSCPTNTGTGLRASTMLHLPALSAAGQGGALLSTVSKLGLTVRGLYGEGSEANGNIYQLSNQVTLGRAEEDMIKTLIAATGQICGHERTLREQMKKDDGLVTLDKLMRSVGVMGHARLMALPEFMQRYSDLRLLVSMGTVYAEFSELDKLMMDLHPGSLAVYAGTELSEHEQCVLRADLLREFIRGIAGH